MLWKNMKKCWYYSLQNWLNLIKAQKTNYMQPKLWNIQTKSLNLKLKKEYMTWISKV